MRRIYISGPVEGQPNYVERFSNAEELLCSRGFEICNPLDAREPGEGKNGIEACRKLLADCDEIYMLDGWGASSIARLEFVYAVDHKMTIRFEGSL